MDQPHSVLCASQSGSPTLPAPFPWPGPAMGSSGGARMSAEASEMWQSLRLPWGGRRKKGSQEHLCAEGLGLLGTRWWWSYQPGSGTSCLPCHVTRPKLFGLCGPLLCSVTQGTSACCYPPEKDLWLVMSSQADTTAGQTDSSTYPWGMSRAGWGGHASCPACTEDVEEEPPALLGGLQRTFYPAGH